MARTDNFTNFATDVADSIRSMTGETGLIPASEFDTRIKSIETEEDLTEELNTYETEITEQEVSIDTIIEALEGKAAGSGGVLSLQDKSVEITENGTTNIVADSGYDGLNSVDVTVNVEGGEELTEIYSTEEVKTNKTWIDGKPIYRKVFETNFPTITHGYSTYTIVSIDISDLNHENIVDFDGIIFQSSFDAVWGLNWYNIQNSASASSYVGSDKKITVRTNCNWLSQEPITVVLEYTKITD